MLVLMTFFLISDKDFSEPKFHKNNINVNAKAETPCFNSQWDALMCLPRVKSNEKVTCTFFEKCGKESLGSRAGNSKVVRIM